MPEHFHLPVSEPEKGNPSGIMQALKQGFARRVLRRSRRQRTAGQIDLFAEERHVWQHRFYDFNVWTEKKRVEKLRYMHRNPVRRGLVQKPEQWHWSSFRHYAYGEVARVQINAIFPP